MDGNEATTPNPKKEEATPPGKKEAITSDKPEKPGKPENQEPQTPPENKKTVAELEGEVEDLTKQLKQRTTLQGQADKKRRIEAIEKRKLEIELKRIRSGDEFVEPEAPEGESQVAKEVRLEAKIGIQNLILDSPEYQELIRQDITLKEVLKNNPFALIGEYFDAEDAVEQIKEKLDERVSSLKSSQSKEDKKEGEEGEEGPEFEAGPTQPKEEPPSPPTPPSTTPETPDEKLEKSIEDKIEIV